ncbi:MAG: Holliday junction branch migration protein RuvA [Hyphomicrobiales bacterium]|nr:Holliday junction branch migration protein RuvA [Hyphomicrobiales bacterium]
MIGKLRGVVDSTGKDWVMVDVNGVGYEVSCASRTLSQMPAQGMPVTLTIETHVREDAIKLFGFLNDSERNWFRLLQNVQGVGAKVALSVLGVLSPGELASAIALQDKAQVGRAPGVGPKVAQRIVSELKDKAPGLLAAGNIGATVSVNPGTQADTKVNDTISALVNLGYSLSEATVAVMTVVNRYEEASTEELIRHGLKELVK